MSAPESASLETHIYPRSAHLLAQTFYIQDHQQALLAGAHKYDYDIQFYDQIDAFVAAAQSSPAQDLFVVDLDSLNNLYNNRKIFLFDLLKLLPESRNYIFLQTERQSNRLDLQRHLIEHNCLAYLEKPFSNEYLIEKIFNLFVQNRRDRPLSVLYLGEEVEVDYDALAAENVRWVTLTDVSQLNRYMKDVRPAIVLMSEPVFEQNEALAQIIRKNIEFDYSLELYLHDAQIPHPHLLEVAMAAGFDDVIPPLPPLLFARFLLNRISRIRTSKNLISQDRATGLLNKVGFQNAAVELIKEAGRANVPMSLCVTDIDKFKTINDTYGHYFGDIVIKRLSLLLNNGVGAQDLLGRFGGEEFVLLMWDTPREAAMNRMNALRVAFNQLPFEVEPGLVRHFSFSGGVACYPELQTEADLFLQADEALYQAKQNGRNQICG